MHDAREGWYAIGLGIDVGALLDQLVAQSFELGLDRVHQHSPLLHTPQLRVSLSSFKYLRNAQKGSIHQNSNALPTKNKHRRY